MSEIPQAIAKNEVCTIAVEHHVMDILNPTLHHHDLLQSYVRTRIENSDPKQDSEENKDLTKKGHLSRYSTIANSDDNNNGARYVYDKSKRNNDKKEKEKFDDTTIESEMRIQKSRKK